MLIPINSGKASKMKDNEDYENYRWFFTSNNVLAVGGKNDEQNELVIKNFSRPDHTIMHTRKPGSPFMILQTERPSKKDIEEAAIFCGCFSKQWKSGSKKIDIDIFKGEQVYKSKIMKTGTFGVKGKKETLEIKPELVLVMQKGKFRSVPRTTREEILAVITPGKMSKEDAAEKITKRIKDKYHLPVTKEEIMQAIPSNNLSVKYS